VVKRLFDFLGSLVGLLLLLPLFIVVSVMIKASSSGPVFFRQKKIGKRFRPFDLYKFRTMTRGTLAAEGGGETQITPLGRRLCALKIDGLPQLINVLKGEMSLIGPRPERPGTVEAFKEDYKEILKVLPGISDLASIAFRKESSPLVPPEGPLAESIRPQRLKLAKTYVQNQSFPLDLKILFATLASTFLSLPSPFKAEKAKERKRVKELIIDSRTLFIFLIHFAVIIFCNYSAFWLRFDGNIPTKYYILFLNMIPLVLLLRFAALYAFGLNQGLWRYAGLRDLISIGWAVIASSAALWGVITLLPWLPYPRSIYLIDSFLLLLVLSFLRVTKRVYRILMQVEMGARRVLIIGAGNAGEMISREMKQSSTSHSRPVAFIDDDPKKRSKKIHNIPVIGNCEEMKKAVEMVHPDEILIAIPSATPEQMKRIIKRCKAIKLPMKSLPNIRAIIDGKVSVTDIRNLDIEDLIGRTEIRIHDPEVATKIKGKRILITGAGGSIGSELCRQVAALEPERLILFERSENNLYQIELDILERFPGVPLEPFVADILNTEKLDQVFSLHRPQIIFHAAAYKHVPMMERDPLEAVQNNIIGTHEVMKASDRYRAEEFVLISTDKAVSPTSVMGATKRVNEMMVQHFNQIGRTKLVSVRFGNVLESCGSVVPLFREQIKKGGPVKVTHPEIRRYFITIQEAVQLVLQAAVLGEGGEIFVLDMGESIKVIDLARTMIILSGFLPEKDIPIQLIGLRPGEKLVESLFEENEEIVQTRHEKIRLARNGEGNNKLPAYIEKFAAMNNQTEPMEIKLILKELIQSYQGDGMPVDPPVEALLPGEERILLPERK
jgi:FlaA1/EpsC-like NDP-sugar epimerase/lipopolysaccharide/colanic/teichoic acid biosynthesis glycosyltransferase